MLDNAGGSGSSIDDIVTAGRELSFTSVCGDLSIRDCNHMGLYPYGAIEVAGVSENSTTVETVNDYPAEDFVAPCADIACEFDS